VIYYSPYFAQGQAYGEGAYNEGLYSCTEEQVQQGVCEAAGGTSDSGGNLSNTGVAVLGIVTIACLIIFAALVIRIWRRKPALQEAESDDSKNEESINQPSSKA